ncbi:hypothetical protein MJO28_004719 [Puccinia striiformis f. sp. tritici]|uniref:Homeobox domain-containing protein n=2 Tax=Puccinia striiformis TaxID=27350 RepID=A0A2S4V222_9BASI|nr:hypothetical protein Pst134EA_008959 [Puccinia striiformis f. sp. tritici]KAH9468419.1 hypothetical protein Pst134EA_008959 [Puccinia striiformis f. sp. tritici]KAI7954319.1 hypothetical protein MJO28_004719 [Puccinia striiformis f. sp. tritici]KAI9609637.1 hypothetical protein H4Q26_007602 [Puccinia striiformis f. sp. tritici PST-130]POW03548.1 hypothetical protein PSTT_11034 [Puccinia striiformis]
MSFPEADGNQARANGNGGGCLDHEIIPKAYGEDRCEIPLAFYEHNLKPEWSSASNTRTKNPAHTGPCSTLLSPALGLASPGYEFPTNPVSLPPGNWNPLVETSFPSQLEQMNLGNPTSEDFLTHQFDFLNTNGHPELLSYEYNQPLMVSSPTCQLSETDSLLPFENSSHASATYLHTSAPSSHFYSKPAGSRDISPSMLFSQEPASYLTNGSSGSQPLPEPSSPLGLDYYPLENTRTVPQIGMKRSLPIINRGEMSENAHENKGSFLGFERHGRPGLMHDFHVLPNTTSKYQVEGFREAGESSSHLSWDMRTRSSSSRSPSYDQSSSDPAKYPEASNSDYLGSSSLLSSIHSGGFPAAKVPTRGSTLEPEKSNPHGKKQNSPQIPGSRDHHPTIQKRTGSLIDIHHLTNHVPRRRLTVEQEQILLRRFAVQEYLSKREMEELAEKLKIPTSQLRTWFGNRRSKLKAAARQKAKMEAGMGHLTDAELRSLNKRS